MNDIESQIMDIGIEIFKGYGVDDLTARILSILNFEPDDISMEELAARTGYSLASISLKMKNIENFWGIRRIQKPGSRKVYFQMEKNLLDAFTLQIKNGYEAELNIARNKISPLINRYRKEASTEEEKKKLSIFENYQQQILNFEELIKFIHKKVEQMKMHDK
jgi:DNA-binding transcriptional regulator GbsR (MarR family)